MTHGGCHDLTVLGRADSVRRGPLPDEETMNQFSISCDGRVVECDSTATATWLCNLLLRAGKEPKAFQWNDHTAEYEHVLLDFLLPTKETS